MKRAALDRHWRIGWIAVLILVGSAATGAWFYRQIYIWLTTPVATLQASVIYETPRGASLLHALNQLKAQGLIAHPRELALWMRITHPGYALKAGEYELVPPMTPIDIAELLGSGKVLLHKLTIIEGTTVRELRSQLAAEPIVKTTTEQLDEPALMRALGSDRPQAEGEFFPDTYRVAKGTSDMEVLRIAYERMQKTLAQAWAGRDPGLPLADPYEALILASIVEKETALASERPLIAGVFIERLRKGMRLQTDPTVIYGLGDRYDGNIHKADLLRDTPYNTYTRRGLPPTPICLPGAASIDAVLHPQITGALFFVATGEGGSHHFSKTLEEHDAALRRYLKTLRRR